MPQAVQRRGARAELQSSERIAKARASRHFHQSFELSDVRAKLQLSTGTGSFKDATDLTFLLDPCVLP